MTNPYDDGPEEPHRIWRGWWLLAAVACIATTVAFVEIEALRSTGRRPLRDAALNGIVVGATILCIACFGPGALRELRRPSRFDRETLRRAAAIVRAQQDRERVQTWGLAHLVASVAVLAGTGLFLALCGAYALAGGSFPGGRLPDGTAIGGVVLGVTLLIFVWPQLRALLRWFRLLGRGTPGP
jgi:hypothetical protein